MSYNIKLSQIEKKLREVYKLGYGDTIELKNKLPHPKGMWYYSNAEHRTRNR